MQTRAIAASLAGATLLFAACGSDSAEPAGPAAIASDLPPDVQAVLAKRCWDCHATPLRMGALARLTTRQDLLTKPDGNGSKPGAPPWPVAATRAQLAVQLMRFADDPMPPDKRELATDAEVAVLKAWIDGGCAATAAGAAGGAGDDAGCDPYDTPVVCTSGVTWQLTDALVDMNPGRNCVGCHSVSGGPPLLLGGTVYPTAHEPDNCRGTGGTAAVVEITDSAGAVFTLPVNGVGNFWLKTADAPGYKPPFSALVRDGDKVRKMKDQQKDGDCNACHTKDGDNTDKLQTKKAPGRIVLP